MSNEGRRFQRQCPPGRQYGDPGPAGLLRVGEDSINHFFLIGQMIVPGSSYWNIGIGRAKGEVEQDEEALRTMEALGQNMAWLLKKIHA
jgi:multimeric flavodoxin WrbA